MRRGLLLPLAGAALLLTACGSHPAAVAPPSTPPTSSSSAPPMTTTSAAPMTSAAPTTTAAAPVRFTWSVRVSGRTVTYGGSWSGTGTTLAAADAGRAANRSTGEVVGSGVLGWDAELYAGDGGPVPAGTNPDQGDYQQAPLTSTDGDIARRCTGPTKTEKRALPTRTPLTIDKPGTYLLRITTKTCAGTVVDETRFTVS